MVFKLRSFKSDACSYGRNQKDFSLIRFKKVRKQVFLGRNQDKLLLLDNIYLRPIEVDLLIILMISCPIQIKETTTH